jgi:hypothetical protein
MRALAIRGVVAGALGTAAMAACEFAHVRLRGGIDSGSGSGSDGPIDYDVSEHVSIAAARVLRLRLSTDAESWLLFVVTQAGYGSAFGIAAALLDAAGLPPHRQAAVFFGLTQTMALTLFPALGRTPPPWRWRAEPLLTSAVQHAVYAGVVVAAVGRLARRQGDR